VQRTIVKNEHILQVYANGARRGKWGKKVSYRKQIVRQHSW